MKSASPSSPLSILSFPLIAQPIKIPRVRHLPVMERHDAFPVRLSANSADKVVQCEHAFRGEKADSLKSLQVLNDLFKTGVQFGDCPVNMGLHRHQFNGLEVGALALWLRLRQGSFNFMDSHVALLGGDAVRGAFGVDAPGAAC